MRVHYGNCASSASSVEAGKIKIKIKIETTALITAARKRGRV